MSRFMFGWEYGGGLGHVSPISEVAHRLIRRGHEVHAVTRDANLMARTLGDYGIPSYSLPRDLRVEKDRSIKGVLSMSRALYNMTYHSPEAAAIRLAAWRSLIEAVRPDALIINYAPGAILAARELAVPAMQFGTGFAIPPAIAPLPFLVIDKRATADEINQAAESAVVSNINQACALLGWSGIDHLWELFSSDRELLCTLPELDHYPQREGGHYIGPLISIPFDVAPPWPRARAGAPRIFGYLKAHFEGLERLLGCLAAVDACSVVVARGLSETLRRKYASDTLCITDQPVNLQTTCRDADIVLSHAGHGTVTNALLNGASLLLAPEQNHGEQWMTARNIRRLRAGLVLSPNVGRAGFQKAVRRLLEGDAGRGTAEIRQRYADFEPESAWNSVIEAAEETLR